MKIPLETRQAQLRATDPAASAFVSANAGSGKTYVLTRRVIRLLLAGCEPGRILCLTFTKAAAAEMANRVFEELGRWATLPEADLAGVIADIEDSPPDRPRLAAARRLFARALETPGGLKVQTIHAFAEALLQRFAIEAGLDGRFSVLDDRRAAELFAEARATLIRDCAAHPDTAEGRAFASLIRSLSDQQLDAALAAAARERGALRAWIEAEGSMDAALAALPGRLGLPPDATRTSLLDAYLAPPEFPGSYLSRLIDVLDGASVTMKKLADKLRATVAESDPERLRRLWRDVFLTGESSRMKPRAAPVTAAVIKLLPDCGERCAREAERLMELEGQFAALETAERTAALMRLADRMIALVEARKAAIGALDFDDLIERAADLLSRSDAAAWVQYKLDEGLDHILVDEAQDTSPRQWRIVEALTGEFAAGLGAREGRSRTIFAVGDEKQSIYSFQGAAPHLFGAARRDFGRRLAAARQTVHDLTLNLSFRSAASIVKAVDRVFEAPAAHAGLSTASGPTIHETVRGREPGLVELWPEVDKSVAPPDVAWEEPVDATSATAPPVRLANRIADTVAGWIAGGETIAATGKPIQPGDVLILVRKRGAFVEAVNRALKQRGVAVAGADRLDVIGHIVTQDLLAAAAVALLPEDDLTLATIARSPLVGISEEALFRLAHGRSVSVVGPDGTPVIRRETLWAAVQRHAARGETDAERLRVRVTEWMRRADRGEPFAFFARLLGPDGARAAYRARFGREADEVLDELLSLALAYEGEETAGLHGFLDRFREGGELIRREMDAGRNEVRVMTVHGSKGLEAPVVILVDHGDPPASARNLPDLLQLGDNGAPLVWPAAGLKPTAIASESAAFLTAQAEEYRRLLYVGLTRARDRLVIAGLKGADKDADARWYGLVATALRQDAEEVKDGLGETLAWRWRVAGEAPAKPAEAAAPSRPPAVELPEWLQRPPADTAASERLRPSSAYRGAVAADEETDASRRGTHLHRLLELLPDIAPDERADRATAYLDKALPDLDPDERAGLTGKVMAVLAEPSLVPLFSKASRAEVAVTGDIAGPDGRRFAVYGAVDRLAVTDDELIIADYKTSRNPPPGIPPDYMLQLALYRAVLAPLWPGRRTRAVIIWTEIPRVDEAKPDALDQVLHEHMMGLAVS